MAALPSVTVADLRLYVRWPEAVPQDFLAQHLAGAARDVGHALGGDVPDGYDQDAAEAITALAAASALPFVQTFTQDGGAAAIRTVQMGNNRPHLQHADDQGKTIARLCARAEALIARVKAAKAAAPQAGDSFSSNDFFMGAI